MFVIKWKERYDSRSPTKSFQEITNFYAKIPYIQIDEYVSILVFLFITDVNFWNFLNSSKILYMPA